MYKVFEVIVIQGDLSGDEPPIIFGEYTILAKDEESARMRAILGEDGIEPDNLHNFTVFCRPFVQG